MSCKNHIAKYFFSRLWLLLPMLLFSPAAAQESDFPYPNLPDSIQEPSKRLEYLMTHYWDRYDFSDTTAVNRTTGEQGFSDFIYTLGLADSLLTDEAAHRFVEKAFSNEQNALHYEGLMAHYLLNPSSPLRNDVVYAAFLRRVLSDCTHCPAVVRHQSEFRLRQVSKNLPGTVAEDFAYQTRSGTKNRLHQLESPYLLLVFHAPDCENCDRILPQLMKEPALQDARVKVLAVYPYDDTELWKQKTLQTPGNWIDARGADGESLESLYFIQATPSLYLLDSQKRVLLKDAPPQAVIRYLNTQR